MGEPEAVSDETLSALRFWPHSPMSRAKIPDDNINELRQRLDEIAGRSREDISFHPDRVQALNATFPHTIKYIDEGGGDRSDCMMYVFEIPPDLINVAATFPSILDEFFGMALSPLLDRQQDQKLSDVLLFTSRTTKQNTLVV
jgi:hypothetical protein